MKLRYGAIVPLIGGLLVGNQKVVRSPPEFILSYSPFADNEKNVEAYFPKVPRYELDRPDRGGFVLEDHKDVDFVSAVCPCAGLSLLSTGSPEQRAKMNSWMLRSAEFVLGELKPKVFWGENAPALYTKRGEEVRGQLRGIGAKNGYSFSVFYTSTSLHGIPQARKRAFYFYWRDDTAPIFEYYRKRVKNLSRYLAEVKPGTTHHTVEDLEASRDLLLKNPYVKFLQEKWHGGGIADMRRYLVEHGMKGFTLFSYMRRTEQLEEASGWFEGRDERYRREALKLVHKLKTKGSFWDGSFPLYRGDLMFGTLIFRTGYAIHPTEDRCLTTRERLHLMGLPHNFNLVTDNQNHIFQNVPVNTGADMTREVVAYLRGERRSSNARFLMQNNHTRQVDHSESALLNY